MDTGLFTSVKERVLSNCGKVIVGKDTAIERVLTCFLCSGHILLEDVPGTGKTMLLRSFARTIGGSFRRIQFTPDLLPSDLTGINFYNQKSGDFEFRPGPLFSQIILADEINRATPRTQSSLLESMEERQITVDGVTYPMDGIFMVMATQNPIENYGTFPLPEAQLDRFFMRLSLGYMTREQELAVISRRPVSQIVEELDSVVTFEEIDQLKKLWPQVEVSDECAGYIMDVVQRTRNDGKLAYGVSTRGAIALYSAAQVTAALSGRDYVIPEDIRALVPDVLGHRIFASGTTKKEMDDYFTALLAGVSVPTESI